jgi:hypothetical protein
MSLTLDGTSGITATSVVANSATGIGYTTGSGGSVTQLTSKATNLTLNTLSGQITMNNAALASGATVSFTCTNSSISSTDTVNVQVAQGSYTPSNYRVNAYPTNGNFIIAVTNWSGGSLSEAIVLNFAIIKGASS